jgi:Ca-activated chloride channel family protein
MTFIWPQLLWALAVVPLLVALYVWLLARRKRAALRYASLTMVKEAMGAGPTIRRHIPPVLFLLAIVAMLLAMARPAAIVSLPSAHETVILAIDVSGSMRATDVQPNRLAAAQAAAKTFIAQQPRTTRIGVVSFAGTAAVVQAPTLSREDAVAAIDRFQLQRGTAVGSGLLVSLKTIFPDVEFDLRSTNPRKEVAGESRRSSGGVPLDPTRDPAKSPPKPVPPGSYGSAVIILLTDGQTTAGPDPVESARIAADRGVRVYTVGVGTADGQVLGFEGWSFRARLDEEALKQIANVTLGEYFYAGNAADLKKIYQNMTSRITLEKKETEVSALFAAAAAALALLAALLSLLWFNRIL